MVVKNTSLNGAWTNPALWSTGVVPGASDDVDLEGAGATPFSITGASGTIQTLTLGDGALSGVDLTVAINVTMSGLSTLSLSGTLTGEIISSTESGATVTAKNIFASLFGDVDAYVSDGGLVRGDISGARIFVAQDGSLEFDGSNERTPAHFVLQGASHLVLDHASVLNFPLDIDAVSSGDTIDLAGAGTVTAMGWDSATGALSFTLNNFSSLQLTLAADAAADTGKIVPTVASDGHGGSLITFQIGPVAGLPAQPVNLADAAISNGYVNAAGNAPTQTLTGTATGNVTITVYDGATVLGTVGSDFRGDWSFQLGQLADGAHSLTAKASNAVGDSPFSAPLNFTVDTHAPAAPTGLADAAIHNGVVAVADDTASQTLTGQAAANTLVAIIDTAVGATLGATSVDAQGDWSFTLGHMDPGLHQLVAFTSDGVNVSAPSSPLTFTVAGPPLAIPTNLANAAISNGYVNAAADVASQTLTGEASANTVVAVIDAGVGAVVGAVYVGPSGTWSLPLGHLADGVHQLYALATDGTDVTAASTPLTFTVDTVGPTPEVLYVAQSGSSYTVFGYSDPGQSVKVFDNDAQVGASTPNAQGIWSITLALDPNALHSFTEQATDAAGNPGTSTGQTLFSPNVATLVGGAGDDVLIAWGNETLTGGGGHDRFVVDSNFTQRAITDFAPGTDLIELDGSVYHDFATLSSHAQQSGANTVITVNGEVLTLQNVTLASLHASDFMFV
jgi:hypothetical protein